MGTYVLVHGASHDGSAFDEVVDRLQRLGHNAYAPTVAGHGKNAERDVGLAAATASVVEQIVAHELDDFVLLGHSWGGVVIAKVAEALPERIRRLIFFSAMVLRDGECAMDVWPPQNRGLITDLAAASTDNSVMLPFPFFRDAFMNDADLATARSVYDKLSPEPYRLLSENVDLSRFETLDIPRSWLMGTEDIVMPPGEWGWHPADVEPARPVPARADARRSRVDVHEPCGTGREDRRGRTRPSRLAKENHRGPRCRLYSYREDPTCSLVAPSPQASDSPSRPTSPVCPGQDLPRAPAAPSSFASLKNVEAGDLSIGYAEDGAADGSAVILLHGWPYDIHSYADVAPLLVARGYRILVPYLRGYGSTVFRSVDTMRTGQQAALAQDVVDFMDALGIDRAVIGGFDWGQGRPTSWRHCGRSDARRWCRSADT